MRIRIAANVAVAVMAIATLAGIVFAVHVGLTPVNHHYPVGIGCGNNGHVAADGTCQGEHP